MAIEIHGATGEVRWGYRRAASVGTWEIHGTTLTASIQMLDAFAVLQRPLKFAAVVGKGQWCWPIDTIRIEGRTVTAVLGKQEQ